jgi:hypothetical protein
MDRELAPSPEPLSAQLLSPSRPIDWNALVKPIVFVAELILAAVVAFGTADQLIFVSVDGTTHCALDNSMAACASVIAIGSVCFLGAMAVLWRRLLAVFASDFFAGVDEAVACCLISIGWLVVASIITHNFAIAPELPVTSQHEDIIMMRNTITAFAWLNTVLYSGSAFLALFVSDRDPPKYRPTARTRATRPSRASTPRIAAAAATILQEPPPTHSSTRQNKSPESSSASLGASTGEAAAPPYVMRINRPVEELESPENSLASIGASTGDEVTPPSLVRESLAHDKCPASPLAASQAGAGGDLPTVDPSPWQQDAIALGEIRKRHSAFSTNLASTSRGPVRLSVPSHLAELDEAPLLGQTNFNQQSQERGQR